MNVPGFLEVALLALASWRTYRLLSDDTILDRPRNWATRRIAKRRSTAAAICFNEFILCPFCLGFWTALAWWGAWEAWPHGALVAAGAVAVTALVPLIERLTD